MKVAEWLYEKRKSRGYSQQYVANKLHIQQQQVSQWEMELRHPSFERWVQLFKLYKCTDEEIAAVIRMAMDELQEL